MSVYGSLNVLFQKPDINKLGLASSYATEWCEIMAHDLCEILGEIRFFKAMQKGRLNNAANSLLHVGSKELAIKNNLEYLNLLVSRIVLSCSEFSLAQFALHLLFGVIKGPKICQNKTKQSEFTELN